MRRPSNVSPPDERHRQEARLGLALGGFTAAMVGLVAYWFCKADPEFFSQTGAFYRYQTLASGLLAIGAGGFVYHQTRTNIRLDGEREGRRGLATRSTLPHLLDRVTQYAQDSIEVLNAIRGQTVGGLTGSIKHGAIFIDPPVLPFDLIERLAIAVESLPHDVAKDAVSWLLKHLQIQNAQMMSNAAALRRPSGHRVIVGADNIDSVALTTGVVYRIASNLFPYARREVDTVPLLTKGEILSALHIMRYDVVRKPEFYYSSYYRDRNAVWED